MPGRQRILLVEDSASASEVSALLRGRGLGRDPLVLVAPTREAKRVTGALGADPTPEVLLAPVRFPDADRGHRLDALVRRHALRDRFRDVVVVADEATLTLLLRVLAPDQLSSPGAVTLVGLPRGDRPVPVRAALVTGVALALVASLVSDGPRVLLLPAAAAVAGGVGLAVPPWRHVARALLIAAGVSAAVILLAVAGSARFPASQ